MTEYGWPPRMLMRIACAYTGRSRWALARAVREGTLQAAGRNGRSLVFERAELDRWIIGTAPIAPERSQRPATHAAMSGASSSALERLRTLTARGGR